MVYISNFWHLINFPIYSNFLWFVVVFLYVKDNYLENLKMISIKCQLERIFYQKPFTLHLPEKYKNKTHHYKTNIIMYSSLYSESKMKI